MYEKFPKDFVIEARRTSSWLTFAPLSKSIRNEKENFRISENFFEKLSTKFRPYIQKNKIRFWNSTSVEKQVAATYYLVAARILESLASCSFMFS